MSCDDQIIKRVKQASYSFYIHNAHLNIDYKDVLSESFLIMLKALETWDPVKGRSKESWVVFLIHRELRKMYWKEEEIFISQDDIDTWHYTGVDTDDLLISKEKFENLSGLSKYIFNKIFNGEIKTDSDKKNTIKQAAKKQMRKDGISWGKIRSTFRELKDAAEE